MLGYCAENYPNTVRRAYQEGHQICSHSYDHPALTTKSDDQIRSQMRRTDAALDRILGMDFNYIVRPPYGDVNGRVLSVLGNDFNAPSIIWSVDPYDWRDRNAQTVCNRVVSGSFDGSIVLVHDIYSSTVNGILNAIDILADYGYEFVTLNELYRRRNVALVPGQNHYFCKPTGTDYGPVTQPVLAVNEAYGKKEVVMTAQPGADIYYTTDGSDPIYSTQRYTGPVLVQPGTTIRAVSAYNLNGSRSSESSVTTAVTTLQPVALSVLENRIVMNNPNEGTDLRITTDGSPVTETSPLYSEPLPLFDGMLRYRVYGPGVVGNEMQIYVTTTGNLYRDVPTTEWYADEVDRSMELGLFRGVGDYCFAPRTPVNRAMFVTVLYRLMESCGADVSYETGAEFPDAPRGWYTDALSWAAENEIVKGYADGSFGPEQEITREEMCVMLSRALQWYGYSLPEGSPEFTDMESISFWSLADVIAMTGAGLLQGYEDGSFRPQQTASRAEAATILLRAYDALQSES